MEEIISIHSFVHKKKKNLNKNKKNLSTIHSSSKTSKNLNCHSSNNLTTIDKKLNNINKDLNINKTENLSQKKFRKTITLSKKYGFELQNEPLLYTKNDDNLKMLSEKKSKANTPVMKLQKNKKPNYLMKSAFIKDKSLTPQEKSFQNSLCPIYDFYKGNSGFNTTKNDNLVPNSSFTQYYNNFKIKNNPQVNDYLNPSPSPLTNLSDKNNMNYYYNFSFLAKKQTGKDFFETDKINEEYQDKSSSIEEKENNYKLYNIEKDENFGDLRNEMKNIEGNTPSNLGGAVSPSYDLFDENIFRNDNNLFKSPINYKQMNVNININNNSQNNNIYYQLPNIISNFNNNSNNYFNSNQNNNKETNNTEEKYINYNNHIYQNNNQINNNNLTNILKRKDIGNIKNDTQNTLNNNQVNLENLSDLNKGYNTQNTQNILSNPINYNKQMGSTNFSSIYNKAIYQNEMNNRENQLNHFGNLNQNMGNYINQFSKLNNNNINMNDIASQNYRNNNINNYNLNYDNQNLNNQNNINFSSIAKAYMNQNNNQNINQFQMQIPIQNPNNINNNYLYNQPFQYYINQEKISYQNNNIYNQNLNNNNINFPYMNNINSFNQYNQNNNSTIINNHMNSNSILQNNNTVTESLFCQLSPIQLAQQCHIIAKNQNGCRYLQNYISSNPDLLKKIFFPKILEHFQELSNDQFSNYLIKRIFQYLNEEMLFNLIQNLIPLVEQIGTNQYGTRVLQDLIDFLNTEKIFLAFVNIIIPYVKLLVTDLNGSHIIYKLILTKNKKVKIIEDIICMQVKDIAITRKGCSFLKKYFDFENENDLIKIKQCILQNLTEIITDQYGNYVIQSILIKEGSVIVKDFINEISKNIVFFSNNKFSSNAVEKCFENESMKNIILEQILQKDIFEKIILDKFGNYVVQKAIAKADDKRRNFMLQLLIPLIPNLKNQYFGQRLISKLILQYPYLNISS